MYTLRIEKLRWGNVGLLPGFRDVMSSQATVVFAPHNVLTNVRSSAAIACFVVALAGLNASSARAEPHEKQNRSAFEYHDGQAPEKRPYRKPKLDIDPTDLSLEEMRARLNYLEERIERLEQVVERFERPRR